MQAALNFISDALERLSPPGPSSASALAAFPLISCELCSSLKGGGFRNEGLDRRWGRRGEGGTAGRRALVSHRLVTL